MAETMSAQKDCKGHSLLDIHNGDDSVTFSMDQLYFISDISFKQLGVLSTFTQKQIDALRTAYKYAECDV